MEKDCLNENVLTSNKSLKLEPKTKNFQLYQRYNVTFFYLKNAKSQYKKSQKEGESSQENKIN